LHKIWIEFLIHTRLQPGDRNVSENRKPFRRFPCPALPRFTWLKPGVNDIRFARRNSTVVGFMSAFREKPMSPLPIESE